MTPKHTILSNLDLYFSLQGLRLADYVTITLVEIDRAWGWPKDPLTHLTSSWPRDPSDSAAHFHGIGTISTREPGAVLPALQVCYHPDQEHGIFAELDFDYAAPLGGDLTSFFTHAWEVVYHTLTRTKTNQARIARMLNKRFRV